MRASPGCRVLTGPGRSSRLSPPQAALRPQAESSGGGRERPRHLGPSDELCALRGDLQVRPGTGRLYSDETPASRVHAPQSNSRGPGCSGWERAASKATPYLGFAALQPLLKEDIVGTGHVGGKGVLPDRGVWGLVQVGQVLERALAEVLQGCGTRAGRERRAVSGWAPTPASAAPSTPTHATPPHTGPAGTPGLHWLSSVPKPTSFPGLRNGAFGNRCN